MPSVGSAASVIRIRELYEESAAITERIGRNIDTMVSVKEEDREAFEAHLIAWRQELNLLRQDLVAMTGPLK